MVIDVAQNDEYMKWKTHNPSRSEKKLFSFID